MGKEQGPISKQNFLSNPLLQTALRPLANTAFCPFSGEAPEKLRKKAGDKASLRQNPDPAARENRERKTRVHYLSSDYILSHQPTLHLPGLDLVDFLLPHLLIVEFPFI